MQAGIDLGALECRVVRLDEDFTRNDLHIMCRQGRFLRMVLRRA